MKKLFSLVLVFILLITSSFPVTATTIPSAKEEVVYGILGQDGSVRNLYVVNIFPGSKIIDYGNYSEIRNMTSSEEIKQSQDKITIDTIATPFYYQGNLISKELPWNILVKYYINDKEVSGLDLAGQSGQLKINISVSQNPNIDPIFYENYALQIALTLDNKLCSNIKTDQATIAEAGGKKQVNFTLLPGNPFEASVTADVKNFEMDSITFNAIRLNLKMDIDSDEFSSQISQLITAVEELDSGAGQLLDGLKQLSDGMDEYVNGMKAYHDGMGQLSTGVKDLSKGASSLEEGLSQLTKENNTLVYGALALQEAAFDAINMQLSGFGLNLPQITPDNYSSILSNVPQLEELKLQLDGIIQFTQGLKEYTQGVAELGKGAASLADGTEKLHDSILEIASSSKDLYDAAVNLNNAINNIEDGLASYKDGTEKFKNESSHMDEEIEKQIQQLLAEIYDSDFQAKSFVSDKNKQVDSVQFVLKTEAIQIPDTPSVIVQEPVKLNFWQKLLKLFGLYDG